MKLTQSLIASAVALATLSSAHADFKYRHKAKQVLPEYQTENPWFAEGESYVDGRAYFPGRAKNVILFVGDGMGVSTVTAARILEGQLNGMDGEENNLSIDLFPYTGLAKTYNVDAQTENAIKPKR